MSGQDVPRLLGRPALVAGTSLAGYLWVLDQANLEFGGARLAEALHLDIDRLTMSAAAAEILGRATGRPAGDVRDATLATVAGGLLGQTQTFFCGRLINPRHLLADGMRVCPACLAEGRPHQAEWDLFAVVCCRRHGIWLIDRCPGCRQPLRQSRSRHSFCDCGQPLAKMPAAPAPRVVVEAVWWGLVELPFDDEVIPDGWPPPLPPEAALTLLENLGGCFPDKSRLPREDPAASPGLRATRERIADSAERLSNWPIALAEAIERQAVRESRHGDFVSAVGSAFSLFHESGAAEHFGQFQAVVETAIHRLSQGRLHAWRPLPSALETAAREGALLEARDARFMLKLDPTALNQLVGAGLIKVLPHPREHPVRPYLVPKSELDALLNRMAADRADRSRRALQAIAFKGAQIVLAAVGGSLTDLVNILLTRKVHPVGRDPDQRGLAAWTVDFDDLLAYVLDPTRWTRAMTCADLQSVLQLPRPAVMALLAAVTAGGPADRVDAQRLREFVREHVFPARVALALGVSPTSIAAALRERGAQAVHLGGSLLTLYRRCDVADLLDRVEPQERG